MKVLYDLPIPMGEPHYTIMIDIDEYNTIDKYPVGTDLYTGKESPYYTALGKEGIKRKKGVVHVYGTINNGEVTPKNN